MRRFKAPWGRSEFLAVLFGAGLVAFNWPALSITAVGDSGELFHYLFVAWGTLIVLILLAAMGRQKLTREG